MNKYFIICLLFFSFGSTVYSAVVEYSLNATIRGYVGVGGEIDGVINPRLVAQEGDEVIIYLKNTGVMPHDIAFPKHEIRSQMLKPGQSTTLRFEFKSQDDYVCSIPGHAQMGMKGVITNRSLDDDIPVVDSIIRDASDVPTPISRTVSGEVVFNLEAKRVVSKLEDGSNFEYWTFNGTVPGPLLRVREGDRVIINLKNSDSLMYHSIDFHAASMPHGGANRLQVPPMQTKTLEFTAHHAGLYVYHCATPHVPTHLAMGMYGMILVEPSNPLPSVDREFYVMQGEYYTTNDLGHLGKHEFSSERLLHERPSFVVFNGVPRALTKTKRMNIQVGEKVRLYFGVGGPNLTSSLHIIGVIFSRVYSLGSFHTTQMQQVQTIQVPAGGASIVEFSVREKGSYIMVDHSLSRTDKGAVAEFHAQ